jgi:hypothetical protein
MNTVPSSVPVHGLLPFRSIPKPQQNDCPEVAERAARAGIAAR